MKKEKEIKRSRRWNHMEHHYKLMEYIIEREKEYGEDVVKRAKNEIVETDKILLSVYDEKKAAGKPIPYWAVKRVAKLRSKARNAKFA